jgi:hypothetical protein
MTLLEKALSIPVRKGDASDDEHVELALAWLASSISSQQLVGAINKTPKHANVSTTVYSFVAPVLRQAYTNGLFTISRGRALAVSEKHAQETPNAE